jgi:hypothetical protein
MSLRRPPGLSNLAGSPPAASLLVASLLVGGCGRADPSHDQVADRQSHEAHFPPHWPGNYPAAIERLEVLLFDAQAELSTRISRWEEVNDLIGWLPELAADSDLNEPEWNRLDSAADELARELKQLVPSPSAAWPEPTALDRQLEPAWQTLRAGTERYWEAFYRINPGRRPADGSASP